MRLDPRHWMVRESFLVKTSNIFEAMSADHNNISRSIRDMIARSSRGIYLQRWDNGNDMANNRLEINADRMIYMYVLYIHDVAVMKLHTRMYYVIYIHIVT